MEQNKDQSDAAVRALPSDLTEREQLDLLCQVETYMNVTDKHSQTHPDAEAEEARIYSLVNGLIAKRFSDIGAAVRGEAVAVHEAHFARLTLIRASGDEELMEAVKTGKVSVHAALAQVVGAAPAAGSSTDWRIYHSALSKCADLLDNMADNDALVDVPVYLAAKLSARATDAPSEPSELRHAILEVLMNRANGMSEDHLLFYRAAGDAKRPVSMLVAELVAAVLSNRAADALDSRPTEPDGWRPIDTAPKDGTQIILSNGISVAQGRYFYDEGGITEHRDMDGRYIGQDESDGFDGWMDNDGGMQPDPTHWMPLPPAPASSQPTDGGVRNG